MDLIAEKDNKIYNQLSKQLSQQWNSELDVKIEKSDSTKTQTISSLPNINLNEIEEVF